MQFRIFENTIQKIQNRDREIVFMCQILYKALCLGMLRTFFHCVHSVLINFICKTP